MQVKGKGNRSRNEGWGWGRASSLQQLWQSWRCSIGTVYRLTSVSSPSNTCTCVSMCDSDSSRDGSESRVSPRKVQRTWNMIWFDLSHHRVTYKTSKSDYGSVLPSEKTDVPQSSTLGEMDSLGLRRHRAAAAHWSSDVYCTQKWQELQASIRFPGFYAFSWSQGEATGFLYFSSTS